MSRAITKWQSILDDARRTLCNGDKLQTATIKHKDNSRDSICSAFIQIVNAGSNLCHVLAETSGQLESYKSQLNEKSSLLNDFSGSYNGLRKCLEQNFQDHFTKLETIETAVQSQSEQVSNMLETAKSYSDALREKPTQATNLMDPQELSNTVKTAMKDVAENNLRARRIIIHHTENDDTPQILAEGVIETTLGYKVPIVSAQKFGKNGPICLELESAALARSIVNKAGKLKQSRAFKKTYIAPDRTPEERIAHNKLVSKLKEKIADDPSQWWTIQDNEVISTGTKRSRTDSDISVNYIIDWSDPNAPIPSSDDSESDEHDES